MQQTLPVTAHLQDVQVHAHRPPMSIGQVAEERESESDLESGGMRQTRDKLGPSPHFALGRVKILGMGARRRQNHHMNGAKGERAGKYQYRPMSARE